MRLFQPVGKVFAFEMRKDTFTIEESPRVIPGAGLDGWLVERLVVSNIRTGSVAAFEASVGFDIHLIDATETTKLPLDPIKITVMVRITTRETRLAPFVVAERQVLLWTQPRRPEYFQRTCFPIFNMEVSEGRFYGLPVHHVPGFKIGKYHHRHESVVADSVDRDCHPEDEAVLREGIRRYFPDADGPTLAMKVCMFANTPDGHFVIDHHPEAENVIIAAGFSGHGFKFCGVVGEIAVDLATDGSTRWDVELFQIRRLTTLAGPKGPALHDTLGRPTRHS